MRHILVKAHRWLGLALFPIFLAIILSGMALATRPIIEGSSQTAAQTDIPQLVTLLKQQDPSHHVRSISRTDSANHWKLSGKGEFQLGSGQKIGAANSGSGAFFSTMYKLHVGLLMGLRWLVEFATYLLLGMIVVGLLMGLPRSRKTLLGWHQSLAWWALPAVIILPATATLMVLHIGGTPLPIVHGAAKTTLTQALELASGQFDLSHLVNARTFRGGSVLLKTDSQSLLVSGGQVHALATDWIRALHDGTWAGAYSGALNFIMAGVMFVLSITGFTSWFKRARGSLSRQLHQGASTLLVYASHTGTAQGLGTATAASLTKAGVAVDSGPISAFNPANWRNYDQVLVLASTTGDGEMPEQARGWVRHLKNGQLKGVRFGMLALGDSRYDEFCGGGRRLRKALLDAGANEILPLAEVDGEPATPWRNWLQNVAVRFGWQLQTGTVTSRQTTTVETRLLKRSRLDRLSDPDSPQSYTLVLEVPESTRFAPGDLLQIQPSPGEAPRSYSIGSDSSITPGRIRLTVGLLRYIDDDGREVYGRASRQLCLDWQEADTRTISIVSHPGFNPPAESEKPMILIATGCGIAPFTGFLEKRAKSTNAGPVWLLFGNRRKEEDFLYRSGIERLHNLGVITHLDTTFSRDGQEQRYITERLQQRGNDLMKWMNNGAEIYICGRASTLGKSADQALIRILMRQGISEVQAEQTLEDWIHDGRLHRDLFD